MVKDTYSATLAYLDYSIEVGERGFYIMLSGFNDKLPLLLHAILTYFDDFDKNLKKDLFSAVCDQAKKNYYNQLIDPETLADDVELFLMTDVYR